MQMVESAVSSGDTLWPLYRTGDIRPTGTLYCLNFGDGKRGEICVPSSGRIEVFCTLSDGKILLVTSDRELWIHSQEMIRLLSNLPESPLSDLNGKYGLDNRSTLADVWESGMVKGMGCPLFHRIMKMFPIGDEVVMLTSASIVRYNCILRNWKILALPHLIPKAPLMPSTFVNDRYIYQGTCLGEDGGDLKRIDMKTGDIEILYKGTQVTSVMQDPGIPGQVVYSTGTWHMGLNRGGIYRTGESYHSVFSGKAVYSMTSDKQDIIAASRDGIYRIQYGEIVEKYAYPDHLMYDGVRIVADERFGSFVLTDLYRQRMVCGSVPLFVEVGTGRKDVQA